MVAYQNFNRSQELFPHDRRWRTRKPKNPKENENGKIEMKMVGEEIGNG